MPLNLVFEQTPGRPVVVQSDPQVHRQQGQPNAIPAVPQSAIEAAQRACEEERARELPGVAFDARGRMRVPATRVLYVDALHADVLIEPTPDGNLYWRVCARHQVCSETYVTLVEDIKAIPCLECVAEQSLAIRRQRYADLHAANVRIVGFE